MRIAIPITNRNVSCMVFGCTANALLSRQCNPATRKNTGREDRQAPPRTAKPGLLPPGLPGAAPVSVIGGGWISGPIALFATRPGCWRISWAPLPDPGQTLVERISHRRDFQAGQNVCDH